MIWSQTLTTRVFRDPHICKLTYYFFFFFTVSSHSSNQLSWVCTWGPSISWMLSQDGERRESKCNLTDFSNVDTWYINTNDFSLFVTTSAKQLFKYIIIKMVQITYCFDIGGRGFFNWKCTSFFFTMLDIVMI